VCSRHLWAAPISENRGSGSFKMTTPETERQRTGKKSVGYWEWEPLAFSPVVRSAPSFGGNARTGADASVNAPVAALFFFG
jgi:hypothetical protein